MEVVRLITRIRRGAVALMGALSLVLGTVIVAAPPAAAGVPGPGEVWTARPAPAGSWKSVTYGNGVFVAVANDGTDRVMSSSDGVTWTARSAAEANTWISVTYGNGLFVAVANTGTNQVMTSTDGVTWTARAAAEANLWTSVTYGNGLFVAVAGSGTNRVMTSTDGVTWTARSAAAANSWASVTYGNGQFVAIAASLANQVMTSSDGVTWTAHTAAAVSYWKSVTYGNGVFVAVATSGVTQVMTSSDGATWTAQTAADTGMWASATFAKGLFVAVAITGTNRVMTSSDGVTWTARAAAEANLWISVTVGGGSFLAVAADGTNQVMTSPIPADAPDAPTALVATPGDTSVSIAFTAGSDGGAAISKYQYSTDGGTNWSDADAGTTSPVTVSGLSAYGTYSIMLRAVNSVGAGAASSAVSVATTGAAPAIGSATASSPRHLLVSWAELVPSSGRVLRYQAAVFQPSTSVRVANCRVWAPDRSCTVKGLTPGSAYDVRVRARIALGGGDKRWTVFSDPASQVTMPN